jgi:uncharacterized protein
MADEPAPSAVPAAGAPSDVLMAIYTLPELAAFGDVAPVAARLHARPAELTDYSPDGWPALHLAGFIGAPGLVALLIRAGADLTARSHNVQGNSALHAAIAGRCDAACVTALVAAGSDVRAGDAHGYTPLHLAAARGNVAITEMLVACGALRDVQSTDGKTPASIARERGHAELADRLERADAWG